MKFVSILGKTSLVSIIASSITYLSLFYLAANALNKDFADFSYYQSLILLLINVIPFGSTMAVVIFRYSLSESDYFQLIKHKILVLMPIIFIIVGLIALTLLFLKVIVLSSNMLITILFLCYFNSISLVIMGCYRVSQLFLKYGCYFIIYTLVNSFLLIFIYFYFNSLIMAFYITTFLSGFYAVFNLLLLKKYFKLGWAIEDIKINFISSIKYGLPIVFSSLTMSFLVVGDKLILGNMKPELLASYSVAALISSTTLFLVNNFASAWAAFLVKQCNENEKGVFSCYRDNISKITFVFPLFGIVILTQYIIYFILYKSDFPSLFITIITLTVAYFVFGVSKFFMGYMNYYKKNMAVFYSSLLGVSGVFFVIFISSAKYIALSVLVGMFIQLVFCFIYTNKLLRS